MKKFKCFVSYMTIDGKRVWKLFWADNVLNATETVNLIALNNPRVDYVRIEKDYEASYQMVQRLRKDHVERAAEQAFLRKVPA